LETVKKVVEIDWETDSERLTTKLLQLFLKNGIGNKPGAV